MSNVIMNADEVKQHLKTFAPYLSINMLKNKYDSKKVNWYIGFTGIPLNKSHIIGMDFVELPHTNGEFKLADVTKTVIKVTPEPARIDELLKFHQHSQRETKIELESYERDSLEYQRTKSFIEDNKLYLKILSDLKALTKKTDLEDIDF